MSGERGEMWPQFGGRRCLLRSNSRLAARERGGGTVPACRWRGKRPTLCCGRQTSRWLCQPLTLRAAVLVLSTVQIIYGWVSSALTERCRQRTSIAKQVAQGRNGIGDVSGSVVIGVGDVQSGVGVGVAPFEMLGWSRAISRFVRAHINASAARAAVALDVGGRGADADPLRPYGYPWSASPPLRA